MGGVVICKFLYADGKYGDVRRTLAKFIDSRGLVLITPFFISKGIDSLDTIDRAFYLHEKEFISVKGNKGPYALEKGG